MADATFREVHLVTFENTDKSSAGSGIGGAAWYFKMTEAEDRYAELKRGIGDDYIVAQWNAYVPESWGDDQITDYIEETFVQDDYTGYPIQVHNAPHGNWPFAAEVLPDLKISKGSDTLVVHYSEGNQFPWHYTLAGKDGVYGSLATRSEALAAGMAEWADTYPQDFTE